MPTQVATYELDDSTKVMFEVESVDGFSSAGAGQIVGRVRDAIGPAVDAAKAVLDKVKEIRPDEVEVRFGVKVSGGTDWLVAKSAGEASFEIKLIWTPKTELGRRFAADQGNADGRTEAHVEPGDAGVVGVDEE